MQLKRPSAVGQADLSHYEKKLKNIMAIGPGSYAKHFDRTIDVEEEPDGPPVQLAQPSMKSPLLAMSDTNILPK